MLCRHTETICLSQFNTFDLCVTCLSPIAELKFLFHPSHLHPFLIQTAMSAEWVGWNHSYLQKSFDMSEEILVDVSGT